MNKNCHHGNADDQKYISTLEVMTNITETPPKKEISHDLLTPKESCHTLETKQQENIKELPSNRREKEERRHRSKHRHRTESSNKSRNGSNYKYDREERHSDYYNSSR